MSFSYGAGENSSFVPGMQRPYICCMKNRYPTPAELYALEREARRLRAEHLAQLARRAAQGWNRFWTAKAAVKGLRHA
jgi:hypothetical protein